MPEKIVLNATEEEDDKNKEENLCWCLECEQADHECECECTQANGRWKIMFKYISIFISELHKQNEIRTHYTHTYKEVKIESTRRKYAETVVIS